jgi:hypothetical protein
MGTGGRPSSAEIAIVLTAINKVEKRIRSIMALVLRWLVGTIGHDPGTFQLYSFTAVIGTGYQGVDPG